MTRMTQEQADAHQARIMRLFLKDHKKAAPMPKKLKPPLVSVTQSNTLVRLPAGPMNKTETQYAQLLELRKHAGEILWWKFEGMTLKLADNTRYTPDFSVVLANGTLEFIETKGFMREAARVRLNVAASMFPFPFYLVRRVKAEWLIERVKT